MRLSPGGAAGAHRVLKAVHSRPEWRTAYDRSSRRGHLVEARIRVASLLAVREHPAARPRQVSREINAISRASSACQILMRIPGPPTSSHKRKGVPAAFRLDRMPVLKPPMLVFIALTIENACVACALIVGSGDLPSSGRDRMSGLRA